MVTIHRETTDGKSKSFRVRACQCSITELHRDPAREPTIAFIWDRLLHSAGTYEAIAQEVNAAGYRRICGKPYIWEQVHQIALNPHYGGIMASNRFMRDPHDGRIIQLRPTMDQNLVVATESIANPYITPEQFWEQWEQRFAGRRRQNVRRGSTNEMYGVLVCPDCGRTLNGRREIYKTVFALCNLQERRMPREHARGFRAARCVRARTHIVSGQDRRARRRRHHSGVTASEARDVAARATARTRTARKKDYGHEERASRAHRRSCGGADLAERLRSRGLRVPQRSSGVRAARCRDRSRACRIAIEAVVRAGAFGSTLARRELGGSVDRGPCGSNPAARNARDRDANRAPEDPRMGSRVPSSKSRAEGRPSEGRITRDAGPTGGTPSWRHDINAPDESNAPRRGGRSSTHLLMYPARSYSAAAATSRGPVMSVSRGFT